MRSSLRNGSTIIELLVVLVLVGLLASVSTPARRQTDADLTLDRNLTALRLRATVSRQSVSSTRATSKGTVVTTAYPSGLVVAESAGVVLLPRLGSSDAAR